MFCSGVFQSHLRTTLKQQVNFLFLLFFFLNLISDPLQYSKIHRVDLCTFSTHTQSIGSTRIVSSNIVFQRNAWCARQHTHRPTFSRQVALRPFFNSLISRIFFFYLGNHLNQTRTSYVSFFCINVGTTSHFKQRKAFDLRMLLRLNAKNRL